MGSAIPTKSEQVISFDNNSSASVKAYEGSQIEIGACRLTVNDLPIISENGAGTITLEENSGRDVIRNFNFEEDKINVNSAGGVRMEISDDGWLTLNGSHGKIFVGDIRTLDASTAQGKTSLVGNDLDNTIKAGNGGDDLLVGGAGKNTFFYTNGNETIASAKSGDAVNLSQVTLEQIASTNITADAVTINFKDGGSRYCVNHEQSTWIAK